MMREFTGLAKDGLQTWIAIGGFDFSDEGTPTHTTWSDVCATKARRTEFIDSVRAYMDEYGFQGVDLDWEYPGDPKRGGNGLDDTRNLALLVREMRLAYGDAYGISLTLAPDYWYLRWFDGKAMEPFVDFFGFMAYDLHGSWDSDVLALGKLVRGQADIREIANNSVPLWFDGLDPAKINFGLAMYGRGYTLADPSCNQLLCPFAGASDPAPCTNSPGVMSLYEIQQLIKRRGIIPQYLADSMMKQITWDDQWIGYDDEDTFAAKKAWADSQCFGGTMVWSIDFQVTGSSSDEEKYGDVVYLAPEVFETPTAQCLAPCIMVFPTSPLPEPKVITIPPYTAILEVGTTTTTIVAVSTTSTTTITVIDFFSHYVTSEQPPGAPFTLRPRFQPLPATVVVTGQDGQTTPRTIFPPPLGGGVARGAAGSSLNQTGVLATSTLADATEWPWVQPPTQIPEPVLDEDNVLPPFPSIDIGDPDPNNPDPNNPGSDPTTTPGSGPNPDPTNETTAPYPTDPAASIVPVTDPSKPPQPGATRVRCSFWFFFICISWIDININIQVEWWDIFLPPGQIGPGPLPLHLLKLPLGWAIRCPGGPLSCLPPWPKLTIGHGGEFPSEPPKPTNCETVTATLTIESTSYGTTTTEGTVRTTATSTFSSEFPILGCALTNTAIGTTQTACDVKPTPTTLFRRHVDTEVLPETPALVEDGVIATQRRTPLTVRGNGNCQQETLVDAYCTLSDATDDGAHWRGVLEDNKNEIDPAMKWFADYTVIEITRPQRIIAFVFFTQIEPNVLELIKADPSVCSRFLSLLVFTYMY
jgi:chitinase